MDWKDQAKLLRIGAKRKIVCCGRDPSTYISNSSKGVSLGPCFRCGHREFEPHGERSIAEIMATRRAVEELASYEGMPSDAVSLDEAPREAWVWTLRGGLTPERAEADYGFLWHEKSQKVLIPIRNEQGQDTGIIARDVHNGRPKYRLVQGPREQCYSLIRGRDECVVVEDVLSAIALSRAGFDVHAILGTHISRNHARLFGTGAARTVVGWFDDDKAGHAAFRLLRLRMALYPVTVRRVVTPHDPKLLSREAIQEAMK